MDKLALVLMLAVTAEALVEYGKSLAAAFGGGDYKAAVLQLCAAVVSVPPVRCSSLAEASAPAARRYACPHLLQRVTAKKRNKTQKNKYW